MRRRSVANGVKVRGAVGCAVAAALSLVLWGCAKSGGVFDDVGVNLASPSALAVDAAAARLYVVNSNSKVLFEPDQGSFQVYDISDPLSPSLLATAQTLSFSGQIYLDAAAGRALVPNRFAEDLSNADGRLLSVVIDEAAGNFAAVTESAADRDAFAIACCYPTSRAWITSSDDKLGYVDLSGDLSPGEVALTTTLSDGGEIVRVPATHLAIVGSQAFVSREWGGLLVVNLDEAGVAGASPVDYFIRDIDNPRGIATDGTLVYAVGEGDVGGTWTRYLAILNASAFPPLGSNASATVVSRDDAGVLAALVAVGGNPQEVLLGQAHAFVTNQGDGTVSAIDLATRATAATITVGEEPFSMALLTAPGGADRYLYVGNLFANTISIIDAATLSVAATYP